MVDESILDKIKALLAMAEHPNSNEHEAAIALEKAQELLLQYNLTRDDIQSESGIRFHGIGMASGIERHGFPWKRNIMNVIAKSTLCRVIINRSFKKWTLFGTEPNVKATLEMYRWVVIQLDDIAMNSFAMYKRRGGYEHGRTWKISFFAGACIAIEDRLKKPFVEFAAGSGKELVVLNNKALDEAVNKVFPKLSNIRSGQALSRDGFTAGKSAGNKVTFAPTKKLGSTLMLK